MLARLRCLFYGHRYCWNFGINAWTRPGELNLWCCRCQRTFKGEQRP